MQGNAEAAQMFPPCLTCYGIILTGGEDGVIPARSAQGNAEAAQTFLPYLTCYGIILIGGEDGVIPARSAQGNAEAAQTFLPYLTCYGIILIGGEDGVIPARSAQGNAEAAQMFLPYLTCYGIILIGGEDGVIPACSAQGNAMESEKFIKVYNSLNNHHKQIVFQTLFMMDRNLKHDSQNKAIYDEIKTKQKQLGLGYANLSRELEKLAQKRGMIYSTKTYETVIRRKTINSATFDDICEILQLSNEEIEAIKLSVQLEDQVNIEWLFNSLSPKNRNAIFTLVYLLNMEETSPEYFDPYLIDDE
ncbi:MAG: hypothetical protein K2P41_03925 [Lachnospiraceae bacterium]|nr:hypothetical protein [Lachnospiraceae bacterium]